VEHLNLHTSDGQVLPADLLLATAPATGAVVICHPHPLYGGNRFSIVVDTVFKGAPAHGYHTLRFDFRSDHDHGRAERLDVIAALDLLATQAPGLPLHLIGYSFGAMVAISVNDPRVTSIVAIAPPLTMGSSSIGIEAPCSPILIMSPEHDQFCTPEQAKDATSEWPDPAIFMIPLADHSLSGRTAILLPAIIDWLGRAQPASRLPPHQ
jgi:alpha/beta superfamily hydrolase